jgi:hypothetical protein
LKPISPKQNEEVGSDKFRAAAQVMLGTNGARDEGLVEGDVKAQITRRSDGKVVHSFVLQRDRSADGLYGRQPSEINRLETGDYSLVVTFNGKIANNASVLTDTTRVDFKLVHVDVPPTATSLPTPSDTPVPPTDTPVPPSATAVPPTQTTIPTPLPTATPTPTPPQPPGEFPWWVLGVIAVAGAGGLGFLAWRSMAGAARLNGLRLDPSGMGAPIMLQGKQTTVPLGAARLQFTAQSPSGLPLMTVLSTGEPVNVNGNPYNAGENVPLNVNDRIEVGTESLSLAGTPKTKSGSKAPVFTDSYGEVSSDDYGSSY